MGDRCPHPLPLSGHQPKVGRERGEVSNMVTSQQLEVFCNKARKMGALDAVVVSPPKQVFTAVWVRLRCQFGCSEYGQCLTCPPHSPTPETTRKMLDEYTSAILLHGSKWKLIREIAQALELEVFLAGHYKAFAFLCGPCDLCRKCVCLAARTKKGKAVGMPASGPGPTCNGGSGNRCFCHGPRSRFAYRGGAHHRQPARLLYFGFGRLGFIFHLIFGTRQAQAGEPAAARRFGRPFFFVDGCEIDPLLLQNVEFFIQLRSIPCDLGAFQRDIDFRLAEFVTAFLLKPGEIFSLFLDKHVGIENLSQRRGAYGHRADVVCFDFPAALLIRRSPCFFPPLPDRSCELPPGFLFFPRDLLHFLLRSRLRGRRGFAVFPLPN